MVEERSAQLFLQLSPDSDSTASVGVYCLRVRVSESEKALNFSQSAHHHQSWIVPRLQAVGEFNSTRIERRGLISDVESCRTDVA